MIEVSLCVCVNSVHNLRGNPVLMYRNHPQEAKVTTETSSQFVTVSKQSSYIGHLTDPFIHHLQISISKLIPKRAVIRSLNSILFSLQLTLEVLLSPSPSPIVVF